MRQRCGGPSYTGVGLPDEIFQAVVARFRHQWRTNPLFREMREPSQSRLHILAQEILSSLETRGLSIDHEHVLALRGEVTRMLVTLCEQAFEPLLIEVHILPSTS